MLKVDFKHVRLVCSGIGAVRYRKNGFVAVTAPSVFQIAEPAGWPGFTTLDLPLPEGCPAKPTSTRTLNCSYEMPGRLCGGSQPDFLYCNSTTDCTHADKGTCQDEHPYCAMTPPTWCNAKVGHLSPPQIAECNRSGICVANTVWWCVGHAAGPPAVRVSLKANFATSGPGDVRAGILVDGRPLMGAGGEGSPGRHCHWLSLTVIA